MVFLFICITITTLMVVLFFSKIKVEIINFRFNSQTQMHTNNDYNIIIKILILGKIPILKINITKAKLENIKLKDKFKKINFHSFEKNISLDKEIMTDIRKLNISIKNINLLINIGTENASLTSIIVPIISTVITFILHKKIKNLEKQKFNIQPIYQNQNLVNLYVSGIFEIKVRNIINSIYHFCKKQKKGVKKYERTSNRGTYDYGYE